LSERVAVISTSYPRAPGDPSGHFVAAEVKRAVHAGHEVHVFAPGRKSCERNQDGARLHWLADHGAFGWPGALARLTEQPARALGASAFVLRAVHALRAQHDKGPFQRMQAHFLVPSAWPIATHAARGRDTPELELIGHGSDVRLFCRLPLAMRRRIAHGWRSLGARVRVTSSELATLLRAASPELSAAIDVAASPLDIAGVQSRDDARRSLNLPPSAPLALIVSRLIPSKNVSTALHALALLDGLSVIVVGDGPELPALRAQFPAVRFTGRLPRPQALTFIAAADAVVSASTEEGAPSVVREARALGVPVIALEAGDLAAWAHSDAGLLLVRK
jgi:teichuronic acid biosynthesis glycosyltransferase TuaC